MSAGEFSGVDHDLLADYLGGALDGTPEQAEVARLVAQDPAWAQAHALLAPAVDGVRAELTEWGAAAPEMPQALADRILAALDAAGPPQTAGSSASRAGPETTDSSAVPAGKDTSGTPAGDPASTGAKPALVPAQPLGPRRPGGSSRPGDSSPRPGRRRRRWARVAGPVALAAAAVVGLGVLQLSRPDQGGDMATGTALNERGASPVVPGAQQTAGPASATDPERTSVMASPSFHVVGPPRRTGTDYSPQMLTQAAPIEPFSTRAGPEGSAPGAERLPGPADLERLDDQAALNACLAAIGAEHGDEPLVFDVVDYARFQGLPALVVRFTDVSGAHWSWVSGPACGLPGSGSDTRYRTRVG